MFHGTHVLVRVCHPSVLPAMYVLVDVVPTLELPAMYVLVGVVPPNCAAWYVYAC